MIGVITKHFPPEGLARLTADRIDTIIDALSDDELTALRARSFPVPGPLPSEEYYNVIRADRSLTEEFRAQFAELAPANLQERESELRQLAAFCAGNDSYDWWQAGPWAGKSALMSWFVIHPPAGVDVIGYFVSFGDIRQANSATFVLDVVAQLSAYVGEQLPPQTAIRRGVFLRLLNAAAEKATSAGRRLVLIVDGLDEDRSKENGLPSIASMLPVQPPPAIRIVVSSRPNPPLPDDVPGDHPLRKGTPQSLSPSPHATDIEFAATRDLSQILRGSDIHRDVLGFFTAAGGGLTQSDLLQLTGSYPYVIAELLKGPFGRITRPLVHHDRDITEGVETHYVLAHVSLLQLAERQFGHTLQEWRARINDWAQSFRKREWPAETPTYLRDAYFRMLMASGQWRRALALAADARRHSLLLDSIGGDLKAIEEVETLQRHISSQAIPDIKPLLILTVARENLMNRITNVADIPPMLPALWAAAGQPIRAGSLARTIPDSTLRAKALIQVVRAQTARGQLLAIDDITTVAEDAIQDIPDRMQREYALVELVGAALEVGDHARAKRLSHEIRDNLARTMALVRISGGMARSGMAAAAHEAILEAEECATQLLGRIRTRALSAVAVAAAVADDPDSAMRVSRSIEDLRERVEAMCQLVASGQLVVAEQLADEMADEAVRLYALCEMALAAGRSGKIELGRELKQRVEHAVRDLRYPRNLIWMRSQVTAVLVVYAEDDAQATEVLRRAGPQEGRRAMEELLLRALANQDWHKLRHLIADLAMNDPRIMLEVATGFARIGDIEAAVDCVKYAERPIDRARFLLETIRVLPEGIAGAADLVHNVKVLASQVEADLANEILFDLSAALAASEDKSIALALAKQAEAELQRSAVDSPEDDRTRMLAVAVAAIEDPTKILGVAARIKAPRVRDRVILELASTAAQLGDPVRGLTLAGRVTRTSRRLPALIRIALGMLGQDHVDAHPRQPKAKRDRILLLQKLADKLAKVDSHLTTEVADVLQGEIMRAVHEIPGNAPRAELLLDLMEVSRLHVSDCGSAAVSEITEIADPEKRNALANRTYRLVLGAGEFGLGKQVISEMRSDHQAAARRDLATAIAIEYSRDIVEGKGQMQNWLEPPERWYGFALLALAMAMNLRREATPDANMGSIQIGRDSVARIPDDDLRERTRREFMGTLTKRTPRDAQLVLTNLRKEVEERSARFDGLSAEIVSLVAWQEPRSHSMTRDAMTAMASALVRRDRAYGSLARRVFSAWRQSKRPFPPSKLLVAAIGDRRLRESAAAIVRTVESDRAKEVVDQWRRDLHRQVERDGRTAPMLADAVAQLRRWGLSDSSAPGPWDTYTESAPRLNVPESHIEHPTWRFTAKTHMGQIEKVDVPSVDAARDAHNIETCVKAGRLADAESAVGRLSGRTRDRMLLLIGEAAAQHSDFARAERVARSLPLDLRYIVLMDIVMWSIARHGDYARADRLASSVGEVTALRHVLWWSTSASRKAPAPPAGSLMAAMAEGIGYRFSVPAMSGNELADRRDALYRSVIPEVLTTRAWHCAMDSIVTRESSVIGDVLSEFVVNNRGRSVRQSEW